MDRTRRAVVAFMVAPLVPSCLYTLYFAAPSARAFPWVDALSVVLWISILFTLPVTLIVGIPAYVLIEKHSTLRHAHVLVISAAAGAMVGLALLGWPHGGALLGLSAGLAFCLIWYRARDRLRRPWELR